jgi:hypothetical protein
MTQQPRPTATLQTRSGPALSTVDRSGPSPAAGAPVRLFMTSDVRAATGLSRTHLDFYIREGLVQPVARTESGYLLFDHSEVDLLKAIVADRRSGVPLKDIRQRIGR